MSNEKLYELQNMALFPCLTKAKKVLLSSPIEAVLVNEQERATNKEEEEAGRTLPRELLLAAVSPPSCTTCPSLSSVDSQSQSMSGLPLGNSKGRRISRRRRVSCH